MKHCIPCDRPVRPIKPVSWITLIITVLIAIFLPLIGVPLVLLYLAYYVVFKRKECPICRASSFRMTDGQRSEWEAIKSGRIIDIVGGRKHMKDKNSDT